MFSFAQVSPTANHLFKSLYLVNIELYRRVSERNWGYLQSSILGVFFSGLIARSGNLFNVFNLQWKSQRCDLQTYFNLKFQRFEVDSSLARLPGCSLTREPQYHGTPLVLRPSKVCTYRPRSAWNPLPSDRLVTSLSSRNSRWFVVSCHTSHNRIRKETLRWNFFLIKMQLNYAQESDQRYTRRI